ncbi:hypothetical protein [Bacteroides sp.]|uniref:hypothetical protein n=1 Tax=Bacteroides sp. TaxID=29523 RepID=UPI0026159A2D|nr:hypothetical protein [Bacteroides sp.]MDD3039852.1 hypothetical protein [Bacteroides sp.]
MKILTTSIIAIFSKKKLIVEKLNKGLTGVLSIRQINRLFIVKCINETIIDQWFIPGKIICPKAKITISL